MGQAGKHRLFRVKFRYFTHLVNDVSIYEICHSVSFENILCISMHKRIQLLVHPPGKG